MRTILITLLVIAVLAVLAGCSSEEPASFAFGDTVITRLEHRTGIITQISCVKGDCFYRVKHPASYASQASDDEMLRASQLERNEP